MTQETTKMIEKLKRITELEKQLQALEVTISIFRDDLEVLGKIELKVNEIRDELLYAE